MPVPVPAAPVVFPVPSFEAGSALDRQALHSAKTIHAAAQKLSRMLSNLM
jgi:hypothetical protein